MAAQGLDPSRRSARLVPVVLPLLHGPPHAGRRPPADQALEGDPASRTAGAERIASPAICSAGRGSVRRCCIGPTTAARSERGLFGRHRGGPASRGGFQRDLTTSTKVTASPAASTCQPGLMPASKSKIVAKHAQRRHVECNARCRSLRRGRSATDTAIASTNRLSVDSSLRALPPGQHAIGDQPEKKSGGESRHRHVGLGLLEIMDEREQRDPIDRSDAAAASACRQAGAPCRRSRWPPAPQARARRRRR